MTQRIQQRHKIFYKSLPKVELHRHLEGSLRLSTMIETAKAYSLDIPFDDVDRLRGLVQIQDSDPFTAANFLSKFSTLRLFYQSPEVIKRISREVVADAAADNVRYMEVRFTPVALTRIQDFPLAEAMDWVIESIYTASDEYGVKTRLIASVNRHESPELAEKVIKLAIDRMDRGIVGVDLAGDEANFPGKPFAGIFKEAKQSGLKTTIHAGEWGSPDNIKEAIEVLGTDRIGHGVRVLEQPALVDLARDVQIPFEVCVTSNYQSGVFGTLHDHPLRKMIHAGLQVTINTDDPSLSQIDLSDEYELACEGLELTMTELRQAILTAARAAFLPDDEIRPLLISLKEEIKESTEQAARNQSSA
ncbi:MAG: adenosine deaminase [Anaerolineae bacterium]|nr:adenosine deaminase [Anaerolineae bacterium]